ncbi:7-methyl-GTP pyrophosphatase-like isoform X6 [Juglans microcarpa x Juglans regia]|uniref:7-methyl-GTP pyrophosphatase-like isoform X6 n=1 Tax=Juglans microcarpa x Juglans regia TaxID=2249226 RepID=UPI001B7F05E2|nr:7-methyl-GTP pyrophosphatase-like isoform X6 [Juglans microcarpa x Juglans regia]
MSTNSSAFTIILGSSSMARRQILTEMGYEFTIMSADIDEKVIRREKPADLVMALAEAKADAIVSRLKSTAQFEVEAHSTLLITADTIIQGYFLLLHLIDFEVVVYEGIIREKPSSKEEAREFIKGYSGGQAEVVGSVLVTNLKTGKRKGGWDRAEVGTTDTVMGLPKALTEKCILEALWL